jgi:hypothetical protein
VPLSNALYRHEVQSNKAASDKHKRNEGLTFNQEVMGSNPIALTNKIKELDIYGAALLPRRVDWEAHGKQRRGFRPIAPSARHLLVDCFR